MSSNAIIAILFVIAIVLVAVIIMLAISRMQQKAMRKTFSLQLSNLGNARSRYEVWADDPAHVLQFEFTLNGANLTQNQSAQPVGANLLTATPGQTSSVQSTAAPLASKAKGAASAASGTSNFIGEIVETLGHLLPGSAGESLLSASERMRQGQNAVQRVQRVESRAEGLAGQAQGYASQVAPPKPVATQAPVPASVGIAHYAVTAHPQTPYVEPGSMVELGLIVRPAMRLNDDRAPFNVSSQSLEEEGAQPVAQPGTVIFAGMTGIRYYLPYLVVGGVALLLIVLLLITTNVFG